MKKALTILAASVTLLGSQAAVASRAYITPAAPWTFQGVVNVNKGIALTCDVELVVSGPDDAADTAPPFSHTDVANATVTITLSGGFLGLCSSVIVNPIGPGDVVYTSTSDTSGTFALNNVFVTTITPGNCQGTITGTWAQGSPSTLSVAGTLPAVSGSPCTMNGTLELVDPAGGDVRGEGDSDHAPHRNI